jgi:hypothetical protein
MPTDAEVLAALVATREKLSRRGGWIQDALARSDDGRAVQPFYNGTRYCLRGGVMAGAGLVLVTAGPTTAVISAGRGEAPWDWGERGHWGPTVEQRK